jgi:hypothetical protein
MSGTNDKTLLIVAGLAAFMYFQRGQRVMARPMVAPVNSMPGSVGTGLRQAASGAIGGFLQALANGPLNNTSQTVFPSYQANDYGAVQDTVYQPQSLDDALAGNTDTTWWA